MYKTLADMTPEQRAACVGMWCDVRVPFKEDQKNLVILTHVDSGPKRAKVFGTGIGMTWSKRLQDVTPRCDLPRAWMPDGTPVKGSWTEAEYIGDSHGMRDVYHFDGNPTHRYFETEWEEMPNA